MNKREWVVTTYDLLGEVLQIRTMEFVTTQDVLVHLMGFSLAKAQCGQEMITYSSR